MKANYLIFDKDVLIKDGKPIKWAKTTLCYFRESGFILYITDYIEEDYFLSSLFHETINAKKFIVPFPETTILIGKENRFLGCGFIHVDEKFKLANLLNLVEKANGKENPRRN